MRLKPDPNSVRQQEIRSKITKISRNGREVALNKDVLWWRKRKQRRARAASRMTAEMHLRGWDTDRMIAYLDKSQDHPKAKGRSISELMHMNQYVLAWKLFRLGLKNEL